MDVQPSPIADEFHLLDQSTRSEGEAVSHTVIKAERGKEGRATSTHSLTGIQTLCRNKETDTYLECICYEPSIRNTRNTWVILILSLDGSAEHSVIETNYLDSGKERKGPFKSS